jgi:ligand-binding SRPBCC domain-containing protein
MRSFRVSSILHAQPAAVWARVTTIDGVNAELMPLVRMTGEGEIGVGPLGRSWILLGGVLPIDYDDICLEAVEPGRGFRERSRLGSCSAWHHDRTLLPLAGGRTRVVDEVAFAPRLRAFGGLMAFTFELTFRWRHRRLRRQWR